MRRTYVRRRIAAAGLVLAGVMGVGVPLANAALEPGGRSVPARRVVVRPGDTLWSIARSVAPHQDPRAVVAWIEARSGVSAGAIVPGQVVLIPIGA